MKRLLSITVFMLLTIIIVGLYYYYRWKPLWALDNPKTVYYVTHRQDDTLRIVMIGDSWVGMRTDTLNNIFLLRLSEKINRPVKVKTKGKGGEKSRGIYHLMFEDNGFGTKPLLLSGADYCVIYAGINDAAANLGKKQYLHYMKLIIDFLLANDIRPVLIEIPDVNIWEVYGEKPIKDLMVDFIKSKMTGCDLYQYSGYRQALLLMLKEYNDSVLYVPMKDWNGVEPNLNEHLFLDDQIHLNQRGYIELDSCVVDIISQDLK